MSTPTPASAIARTTNLEDSPTPVGALLAPQSIAVVGASRRTGTIGHQILKNLIAYGFTGAVYPVNPTASVVCSVRAYKRIADLPECPDVAIVVVPREGVIDVAEQCGAAGVRGLVVISAGFREVGGDGIEREQRLMEVVRRHGMRMVGPNCMGILNADPAVSMNGTFADIMPPFGHAAFVSQSGALGLSVLDHAREYGLGISQFVSVGNKPDVSGNDLLLAWENDRSVQVILMYVENFGNPRKFLEIASRITPRKPIIVVKSGRSRAGAKAASSHTGALAASDTAVDALLAQAGVLRASTVEELFEMAMAFEIGTRPRTRRTALLTNAGGPGILAADAMEAHGLELVELSPSTVEQLRPLFPAEASIRNPLDMIASATPDGYRRAMTAMLADPNVDAVVPIFVPPFGIKQEDVAAAIVGAASTRPDKSVVAVLMGREGLPAGRAEPHDAGIPAYVFPESAALALSTLARHGERARAGARRVRPLENVKRSVAAGIVRRASEDGRGMLTHCEANALLRAYGVPIVETRTAASAEDAARVASELGFPVVFKIDSPDVVHKTDIGGVWPNVHTAADARFAYDGLLRRVAERAPAARLNGVLIQPMLQRGRETIVGITRDPSFGPLVMFGLGGVFVEALGDVVFRLAPVDDEDAAEMVRSVRGARMFDSIRGEPAVDRDAIADAIRRVATLASDCPQIVELDVNPLLAFEHGVMAVDARVRIALRESGES
ncbi:MAG: acetate--CoA ligase family protein [Gemmatimonadaceae bacterium]